MAKVRIFKQALGDYIKAVKNQNMSEDIIDNLLASLENIKKAKSSKLKVAFSLEEITGLVDFIREYTKSLAEANNDVDFEETANEENGELILNLAPYLLYQKQLFQQAE